MKKRNRNRQNTITKAVDTQFGKHYVHVELDRNARPVGGWISSPGKDPSSQVTQLIHDLAKGMNSALRAVKEAMDE